MRSVLNLKRFNFKTDLIINWNRPYQNPFERDMGQVYGLPRLARTQGKQIKRQTLTNSRYFFISNSTGAPVTSKGVHTSGTTWPGCSRTFINIWTERYLPQAIKQVLFLRVFKISRNMCNSFRVQFLTANSNRFPALFNPTLMRIAWNFRRFDQ